MKTTTTLAISSVAVLAFGLAPLALAQSPPASTATPPATAAHKAAAPSRPAVTASRAQIRQAQQALVKLGYNLSVDGMMGPQSRRAIRKFQKVNGIPRTGRLNTDTKRGLGLIGGQPPAGLHLGGYNTARVPAAGPERATKHPATHVHFRHAATTVHAARPIQANHESSSRHATQTTSNHAGLAPD